MTEPATALPAGLPRSRPHLHAVEGVCVGCGAPRGNPPVTTTRLCADCWRADLIDDDMGNLR